MSLFSLGAKNSNAQVTEVTINLTDVSIKTVMSEIEKVTDFVFIVSDELKTDLEAKTSINAKNENINNVLGTVFKNTRLTYKIVERQISVYSTQKEKALKPIDVNQTQQPQKQRKSVTGKVTDEKGEPIVGVNITEAGTTNGTVSDVNGNFSLMVNTDAVIAVSFIGYMPQKHSVATKSDFKIILLEDVQTLEQVVVTGYQVLSKERATGAYDIIGKDKIEKKIYTTLKDALEGQTPGLSSFKGDFVIRGVSTFSSSVGSDPLLVIDGMPTERKIDDINSNDIESMTVLKDAAASSIYGVRAANGVIVITTKGGAYTHDTKTTVQFTSDLRWNLNPTFSDYHYSSTSEYMDYELASIERDAVRYNYSSELDFLEQRLKGIGEAGTTSNSINYYSPLQIARLDYLKGNINESQYNDMLAKMRKNDYRKEYMDLMWQTPLRQSYNLSINSSGKTQSTYASINFINDGQQNKYNTNQYLKGFIKTTQKVREWLTFEIGTDLQYNYKKNVNNTYASIELLEPYTSILDESGNKVYRDYVDITSMQGSLHINPKVLAAIEGLPQFESYKFNILDELNDNLITQNYYTVRSFMKFNFKISKDLKFSTSGEYEFAKNKKEDFRSQDSYFYRFMRNKFASNATTNSIIPKGGRLSLLETSRNNWVWRNQLDFVKNINDRHQFNATAGMELKQISTQLPTGAVYYGYDKTALTYTMLNNYDIVSQGYKQSYIYNNNTGLPGAVIDGNYVKLADSEVNLTLSSTLNRYVGMYGVGGYTFNGKYGISGSIRVDQTNLFGTDPKYRYRPLWSAGVKWNMGKEDFIKAISWIDALDIRLSYGLTGNVDQTTTPYLVASLSNQSTYTAESIPYASISSAPNPLLRWEKTTSYNGGIDFSVLNNLINGKLDLYYRNSEDLLGTKEVHFSSGYTTQRVNSGAMTNKGVEFSVSSQWLRKKDLTLSSSFMISYNKNTVTKAFYNPTQASHLAIAGYLVDGKPYDALYAYRYGGLTSGGTDYQNGVPIIYRADGTTMHHFQSDGTLMLDGSSSMNPEDVVYMGTRTPPINASFTQNIKFKGFELSALFLYFGGHKMYLPSFGFNSADGTEDWIAKAWRPDNQDSDIPKSKIYYEPKISTVNLGSLSGMYIRSTTNVAKGDFIRLRNVALSYTLPSLLAKRIKLDRMKITGQVNNPWIWSAAGKDYDSEVQTGQSNSGSLYKWGLPTTTTYLLRLDLIF
jgi:TonB-linked SusC/RagA family outer membrane protein